MRLLGKEMILNALGVIDARAREAGVVVDISIYGGAAMVLAFNTQRSTRDVDAVVHGAPAFVREIVAEIAEHQGWSADWLNDGVKGFVSEREQMQLMAGFSATGGVGLRIHTPSPEYLFAMKCMAMRPVGIEGSHDMEDIERLADVAGITRTEDALALVAAFYPEERIPAKVRFGIEEMMERISTSAHPAATGAPPAPHGPR